MWCLQSKLCICGVLPLHVIGCIACYSQGDCVALQSVIELYCIFFSSYSLVEMCPSSDPDSEYNMGCILYQVSVGEYVKKRASICSLQLSE